MDLSSRGVAKLSVRRACLPLLCLLGAATTSLGEAPVNRLRSNTEAPNQQSAQPPRRVDRDQPVEHAAPADKLDQYRVQLVPGQTLRKARHLAPPSDESDAAPTAMTDSELDGPMP